MAGFLNYSPPQYMRVQPALARITFPVTPAQVWRHAPLTELT
ncbi:MAG: hypothetical protein ACJAVM_002448 [Sulfitobacter sp.]|jgi:hypothetical protein